MLNTDALIVKCPLRSDRTLAYPQRTIRVTSMWGNGRIVYVTDDGWIGVNLDGEKAISGADRVDEYPAEHITIVDQLAA